MINTLIDQLMDLKHQLHYTGINAFGHWIQQHQLMIVMLIIVGISLLLLSLLFHDDEKMKGGVTCWFIGMGLLLVTTVSAIIGMIYHAPTLNHQAETKVEQTIKQAEKKYPYMLEVTMVYETNKINHQHDKQEHLVTYYVACDSKKQAAKVLNTIKKDKNSLVVSHIDAPIFKERIDANLTTRVLNFKLQMVPEKTKVDQLKKIKYVDAKPVFADLLQKGRSAAIFQNY